MAKTLKVLPIAQEELLAAARWYRSRDQSIAEAFEQEIRSAFDAIERFPKTWPLHHHGTRRFILKRFPYEVVYETEELTVIAIAHTRKRPIYWAKRNP